MATITPAVKQITSGLRFPEGPVAMPDGSVILVEIQRQTLSRVTPDGKIHVVATLGGGPNGAAMGPGGKIYVTNNGGFGWIGPGKLFPSVAGPEYTGGRIQLVDPETGKFETLYDAATAASCAAPTIWCSTAPAASGSPIWARRASGIRIAAPSTTRAPTAR